MFKMNERLMNDEPVDGGAPLESSVPVAETSETSNWFDGFGEDIKSNQNITKFSSAEELAKSYINAQRLIGAEKIPMPVTDEDWANTYSRLGRPDSADGYTIEAGEGVEVDSEKQKAFLSLAHEIGLSQKQAQALASFDFESTKAASDSHHASLVQANEEAVNSLKKDWGHSFDKNVKIANRAVQQFASEGDLEFLQTAKVDGVALGNHPAILKLLANVGNGMIESGQLEGKGNDNVMSPQQVKEQQNKLMGHPAYFDRNHPEHSAIVRQVSELFKQYS